MIAAHADTLVHAAHVPHTLLEIAELDRRRSDDSHAEAPAADAALPALLGRLVGAILRRFGDQVLQQRRRDPFSTRSIDGLVRVADRRALRPAAAAELILVGFRGHRSSLGRNSNIIADLSS